MAHQKYILLLSCATEYINFIFNATNIARRIRKCIFINANIQSTPTMTQIALSTIDAPCCSIY